MCLRPFDIFTSDQYLIKKNIYIFLVIFISLVYGLFLAGLPIDVFLDRGNYINYVNESLDLLSFYKEGGVFSLIFNEPVWLLINLLLNYIFDDAEIVIRLYIFFAAITTAFVVLRSGEKYFFFVLLALFFPQIIKNYIIHLRQGLAVALFLFVYLLIIKYVATLLWFFLSFIHFSFLFILALLVFDIFCRKNVSNVFLRLLILVFMCFSLIFSVDFLGEIFGARQAGEYYGVLIQNSGIGFIFWFFIAGLFISQGQMYIEKYFFPFSVLVFYLISYFFLPVSARIFESGIILILFMGLELNSSRRYIFMTMLTIYSVAQYMRYWNEPWLGFGV